MAIGRVVMADADDDDADDSDDGRLMKQMLKMRLRLLLLPLLRMKTAADDGHCCCCCCCWRVGDTMALLELAMLPLMRNAMMRRREATMAADVWPGEMVGRLGQQLPDCRRWPGVMQSLHNAD